MKKYKGLWFTIFNFLYSKENIIPTQKKAKEMLHAIVSDFDLNSRDISKVNKILDYGWTDFFNKNKI